MRTMLTLLTVRTQMQTLTVVPADPEVVASAARFTQSTRACWAIPLAAEPLRDWRNFVALMIITYEPEISMAFIRH